MRLSSVFQNIKTGVSNNISIATEKGSNVASNASVVVSNISSGIKKKVTNLKTSVVSSLTISEKNQKKINDLAKKILAFVIKNKSLIFFGLTVLFSYYMAPAAAFEYLAKTGFSLTSSFVSGLFLGTGLLALKNILFFYPRRNTQENSGDINQHDKINYLLGFSNIFLTHLNPALSLGASVASAGFVTVQSVYRLLPADVVKKSPELTFLVPKELSENVEEPNETANIQIQTD